MVLLRTSYRYGGFLEYHFKLQSQPLQNNLKPCRKNLNPASRKLPNPSQKILTSTAKSQFLTLEKISAHP